MRSSSVLRSSDLGVHAGARPCEFEFTQLLPRRHTVVTIDIHCSRGNNQHPAAFSPHNQEKQSL